MGKAAATDKKQGGIIASVLGGLGAGLGDLGKGVGKLGVGFAKGLGALGAGIAAFMLALGGASMILGLMGSDGSELKAIIENFFGAFSPETAIMMGGLVLMASHMTKAKISAGGFVKNMTALGLGIGAFFIAIGGASWLVDAAGLSGTSLATGINSFFMAWSDKTTAIMGGLVVLAATMTTLKVNEAKFVAGMGALGLGIGAFFVGIGAASWLVQAAGLSGTALATLMTNFFGAFTPEAVALMGGIAAAVVANTAIPPINATASGVKAPKKFVIRVARAVPLSPAA
jgi:hypothetical protein